MLVAFGRILAGLAALACALYAVGYALRMGRGGGVGALASPFAFYVLAFLTLATAFGALALPGTGRDRARRIVLALGIGAGLGVVAGVVGTAYVSWRDPDNDLAPILGMFVIGPAGFVVGTVAAAIVFRARGGRSGRHR